MSVPAIQARNKILYLQDCMMALPEADKVECHVEHFFYEGGYARAMLIPAGTTIIGKIHKHAHCNRVDFGRCMVATEFGEPAEIFGPYEFVSKPGTKRVVVALADTLWITYHDNPTNTTDLAVLEADIIAPSYEALLEANP